MKQSSALSGDPQGVGRAGTRPAPAPSRCLATLHDAKKPAKEKRLRCIHPQGHHGPHFFGEANRV